MNNVQAANLAAARIGHGAQHRMVSFDDDTELGETVREIFQHTLDTMLMQYTWPFARTSALLTASLVTVPTGYGYAYVKPAGALVLHYVEYEGFYADWLVGNSQRSTFEIYANPDEDGQIIVSQTPDAWAWYTKRITELAYTSPLFADAFAWKLAAELALALKADAKLADTASGMFGLAESVAIAQAHNEAGGQMRQVTEMEIVRGTGGRDPAPWLPNRGRIY